MKNLLLIAITIIVASCTSEPSLQSYFVEKSESPDFLVTDIPASILKIKTDALSSEQAEVLNSLDKLNVLIFKSDEEKSELYAREKETVQTILKNPKYEELMRMGSGASGATVYMKGNENTVDEFVVFGHQKNTGFTLVRVLGNKMKPEQLGDFLGALKNADLDMEGLSSLLP